jgi:hypothetical protein
VGPVPEGKRALSTTELVGSSTGKIMKLDEKN